MKVRLKATGDECRKEESDHTKGQEDDDNNGECAFHMLIIVQ